MRLVVIILLFGCNPVKQVLKSPEKTDRVVVEYVKNNPPKNDTIFIPGTATVKDTTIFDTIPLAYPVNHKYTETRVIEKRVRDTITIIDRSFTEALAARLRALEVQVSDLKTDRDYWRKEARTRLYYLIGIVGLFIAAIVWRVVKMFK
jgi:hypothetical protein